MSGQVFSLRALITYIFVKNVTLMMNLERNIIISLKMISQ